MKGWCSSSGGGGDCVTVEVRAVSRVIGELCKAGMEGGRKSRFKSEVEERVLRERCQW